MIIYKSLIVPLKCNKNDLLHLKECRKLSADVWNLCLKLDEESYSTTGKHIQRNQLQKLTKKCVPLHSKGIHYTAHKYLFARDAMFRSIKAGNKNVKLPYKTKRYFNVGWDSQSIKVDYFRKIIYLSKPEIEVDGKKKRQRSLKCYAKVIPNNIVEVEVIYKNKFYLLIKYKVEVQHSYLKSNNKASVDLGEIHAVTSIDKEGNALIITGRKIREIKYFRNKCLSKLKSRRARCKKYSKSYKKYSKAIRILKEKTDNKLKDSMHKISKLFLDYCLENKLSVVFYGDLDSATRDTKKNRKGNRFIRQKLSQWNYGLLMNQISNKLRIFDIELVKVKEYYTSQKCPSCSKLNKTKSRNYICRHCNYEQHRDVVGAINILNGNVGSKTTRYQNKKYLQIA